VAEPISLELAKKRLAITSAHRDAEVTQLIAAARFHVEDYTGLTLTRRQVVEHLDRFGPIITLRTWPIVDLVGVSYLDQAEAPRTVEDARIRKGLRPARLFAPSNQAWPATAWPGDIAITLLAGYDETLPAEDPEAIPPPLVTAMLLLIGHWLENKETVVVGTIATDLPNGWQGLARPYRMVI
jgi:uncharacterized phiE125 gp8 family phage protein